MVSPTSSSFYTDGEQYDEATVVPNDYTPANVPSQAPSSLYPDGTAYDALANVDDVIAEINAKLAETHTTADASAASATASQASANASHASEVNAAASDADAISQAATATTQASIATTQASNASTSGAAALASQNAAHTSEVNAAASSSTATTQAGIATTQAGNAATSASQALASKNAAGTSETNAGTSATNAANSATAAAGSATAANTSKVNAGTSETNAAASAAAALTSKNNAATSETNAASSATSAAGSATTATTQAGNASTSATSASTSLTTFRAVWCGNATSDPTLNGNGGALTSGCLYWNTSLSVLKIYNGSAWTPYSAVSTATVFGRSGNVVAASGDYTFAQIGSTPTTLAGYGITDALKASNNLSDITNAGTARSSLGLATVASSGQASDLTYTALTAANFGAAASAKPVSPSDIKTGLAYVALTDASSISWDLATGINFNVAIAGNRTLNFPTNLTNAVGRTGYIDVLSSGGAFALAFQASVGFTFDGGTAPTNDNVSGRYTQFVYHVRSATEVRIGLALKGVR